MLLIAAFVNAEMPSRYTYGYLKKKMQSLIAVIPFGDIVTDPFVLETLAYHPSWSRLVVGDGEIRPIRKDKYFRSYRMVVLDVNGQIIDDIGVENAVRARTGRKLLVRTKPKDVYNPNFYKQKN